MSEPDPPAALYLTLDENPGDHVTLLALADWYEEQGQAGCAACLRWTVRNALYPFHYSRDLLKKNGSDWHEGWYWWALDDPYAGADWGHPLHCRLPLKVWHRLQHGFTWTPLVFKEYPTLRAAYEALLEAWPRVGPLGADVVRGART
jgi:uncharacterized protein (TIGR02996 family)